MGLGVSGALGTSGITYSEVSATEAESATDASLDLVVVEEAVAALFLSRFEKRPRRAMVVRCKTCSRAAGC